MVVETLASEVEQELSTSWRHRRQQGLNSSQLIGSKQHVWRLAQYIAWIRLNAFSLLLLRFIVIKSWARIAHISILAQL